MIPALGGGSRRVRKSKVSLHYTDTRGKLELHNTLLHNTKMKQERL